MRKQSGQVLVVVAVWMVALIGASALVLLAGSVMWQRNQLQQLADQAALDAALKIGVGCSAGSATTVITEADNFVATQRTRSGALTVSGASCTTPFTGTDTFTGGLSETVHYPYRLHQQQVEVILSLSLPISFGSYMGATNTTVTRRAVAEQLPGSTVAVSANTLSCTGGQFNVQGSVIASNTITRSGGCAIYAHNRFDAASGTYSDLANVSVFGSGQSWVGGGGKCVAGANSGSTNAVCADGYETSGQTAVSCAALGTSEYLSAGNAAVNPNPCAAGRGPQPVAPRSTLLPPDPNTDPAALATLPASAPCSPSVGYPNLVVGGITIGKAEVGTPIPTKDASNYYHFKPSCYGFLSVNSLPAGGSISNRQTGPEVGPENKDVIPTLPVASKVGTLLVATLWSQTSPSNKPFTAPAGWLQAATAEQDGAAHTDIWYYPSNPGGITQADFGVKPASIDAFAQLTEWNGAAAVPLDQTGSVTAASAQPSLTVSTSGAMSQANELVITNIGFSPQGASNTYTQGAGWTGLVNDAPTGYASEDNLSLPAGSASETVTYTASTTWAGVIATFKRATVGTVAGAVLDPGFYYFNGVGFPGGGGGICLNGSTLLARDVTLEFVNQAGFSSGTCLASAPGGCAVGACQFGSTPCSISACPPNSPADSAGGGFTWFAAPCSSAPSGDGSACRGGASWCPPGDRACWNLLMWTPSSSTGRISITGPAAKAWMLGSVFWAGACADMVNGTSTLDGTLSCGALSVSAAAGAGTAVGSDYGINTAVVEAVLVE